MNIATPRKLCTGCSACVSSCPQHCLAMVQEEDGFYYPKVIEKKACTECGICNKVCPIQISLNNTKYDRKIYAAYAKNNAIRERSSSGGIFSLLANEILNNRGVIYAATFDDSFSVKHTRVDRIEDIINCCGAKYAQSQLGNVYQQVAKDLNEEKEVLFSGTPCQVAGLKAFLKHDYHNLYCVDFACHGVPSPLALKGYLKYHESLVGSPVKNVNMRSKITGWSHYNYSMVIDFQNGDRYTAKSGEDLYLKLFVGDYLNRNSCSDCRFKGINRFSDITLADFWGVWDVRPEIDDSRGISAVIIQSHKGDLLIKGCDMLFKIEVSAEEICKYNQSIIASSKANKNRESVLALAIKSDYDQIKAIYFSSSRKSRFLRFMRNKLKELS